VAFGGCNAGESSVDNIGFLVDGTFTISRAVDGSDDDNADGDFDINGQNGDIIIDGFGYDTTIIDGDGVDRVFHVNRNNVTFSDLAIQGGSATGDGGCLLLEAGSAQITLSNVLVKNCEASVSGGGIAVSTAELHLVNSTVKNNVATEDGGGIYLLAPSVNTLIEKSAIIGNIAGSIGGGMRTSLSGTQLKVVTSTIVNNTSGENGGGLHAGSGGAEVINVTMVGNTAGTFGDALSVATGATISLGNSILLGDQDFYTTSDFAAADQCDRNIIDSLGGNIISNITIAIDDGDLNLNNNPTCELTATADDLFEVDADVGVFVNANEPGKARYLLEEGGNAVDGGVASLCDNDSDLMTDQLDLARRGTCDVGSVENTCGDGYLQAEEGEGCEDGNQTPLDGCSAACQIEEGFVAACGDGVITAGESCDDGNLVSGDGCSSACVDEIDSAAGESCGDGAVDSGEECDDGNTVNGDSCSNLCESNAGNGVCSDSNVNEVCCGDGRIDVEAGEFCDDANEVSGDGCSDVCLIEVAADEVPATGGGGCSLNPGR